MKQRKNKYLTGHKYNFGASLSSGLEGIMNNKQLGEQIVNQYSGATSSAGSAASSGASGASMVPWGMIGQAGNAIMGGIVNTEYSNMSDTPWKSQFQGSIDATKDPIMRLVGNIAGTEKEGIINSINSDTLPQGMFDINIQGSDNATLLRNFGYNVYNDNDLNIRNNIEKRSVWGTIGDVANQTGVGALNGLSYSGGNGWAALAGAVVGLLSGIGNSIYDANNTDSYNSAIDAMNNYKRNQNKAYQRNYLTQFNNQVNNVADRNFRDMMRDYYSLAQGGSIHIKPQNRGKFTALMERTGHSASWFKENGTPAQRKMATFALNARKWNHADGGSLDKPPFEKWYLTVPKSKNDTTNYDLRRAYELLPYSEMARFAADENYHLPSIAYDQATDSYQFLKSKDHPSLQYELDWYNGDSPDAQDFRSKYLLDTTGQYYRYLPRQYKEGGMIGTMNDFNNGVTFIENGGTHEENPLGGVPVSIAEDGLPNLVEEGETIYKDYVFSDRLKPSKETKDRLKLKGDTFSDVFKYAQKESSERPNDPISQDYVDYIAMELMMDQETKRAKKEMKKQDKGIQGHRADWGANLMYAPVISSLGQTISDWLGFTNNYDYTNANLISDAGKVRPKAQTVGYQSQGQHQRFKPLDTNYMLNQMGNQASASRSLLTQSAGNRSALQRNLLAHNYTSQLAQAEALMKAEQQNEAQRSAVIAANNALDLQNASNRLGADQFNAGAIKNMSQYNATRDLDIAKAVAAMRDQIETQVSAARSQNLTNATNNIGEFGRQRALLNMLNGNEGLLYKYLSDFSTAYKTKNGGYLLSKGRRRK